ncbi:MAG: FG-GAP-like repeat-containing protein, partial [Saprospiraceae bacterium]
MKQTTLLLLLLWSAAASAQTSFTNQTRLLSPAKHYSGVAIAILDMDGDGRDDIVRMDGGNLVNIEHQSAPNQPFLHLEVGTVNGSSQWGMCAADVDNNGMGDLLTGGFYDGVKILRANADGTAYTMDEYDTPSTFVQGVNFADINNDGWVDAFICHDDAEARIFGNNGDGTFTYQPNWINFSTFPSSDNSGNYGSVWSDVDNDGDLDLYIAHCRQGVKNPTDPRRINQLFLNNGDGSYTQDTTDLAHLRIGAQSWTADFGDIDNDGDFDCFITNHDVSSQILENDGSGHFTDITAAAGMYNAITGLPIEGVFRDFDNDGFVDILVAGSSQYLFHNNGDKTFTEVAGLFDSNLMESFAIGDLNHDGFQDIYGGYAQIYTNPSSIPDALWMNDGNNNHFYGLTLHGVQSNYNAVGARVTLYSALGTQIREVRSGESYGISNSLQIHFGLGQLPEIDSVIVRWPSGHVDKIYQPVADQYATLTEGGCLLPEINLGLTGASTFCTGQSALLTGPAGYSYHWSTGDTLQTILVAAAGTYRLTVTSAAGCTAVSNAQTTIVDPVEIPTIAADGVTRFCVGGSVMLSASPAAGYLWSTGDTLSTIIVSAANSYTVTTKGLCNFFTSEPLTVEVLEAPVPVAIGDTVALNTAATLTASGVEPYWYTTPNGSIPVFTGSPFVTTPLAVSTPYWVGATSTYDQPNEHVGMSSHNGTSFGGNQYNGEIIFDCTKPCRLKTV